MKKRAVVIGVVLLVAAAGVGAAVLMSGGRPAGPHTHDDHDDHDHDHAGHVHGPNGECPLDAKNAVGVDEKTPTKPELGKPEAATPSGAPTGNAPAPVKSGS